MSAGAAAEHGVRPCAAQLERRRSGEERREHEADRRRELEAGVRSEKHAGRREGVEPQEGGAGDEGEGDEQETGVAPAPRGRRHAEPERRRGERGAEDEPEVRRMVLPVTVDRRACEEDGEEQQRRDCDGDPGARTHPPQVSAGPVYPHLPMKVVLPDSSELELPDGATRSRRRACDRAEARRAGRARPRERLDARPAAAARGRREHPVPDDARHGRSRRALRASSLDRAPPRRGRHAPPSRREDRDRPADRGRLLLRLRVPGADLGVRPRGDRGGDPARDRRGARVDARGARAATRRSPASRRSHSPTRSSSLETPRAPSRSTRRVEFTDLCRGPHLQNAEPIKAVKLTSLAGAYWRGDEHNDAADADLRHGLLLAGGPRRAPRAARAGARERPPQAREGARPLPPLRPLAGVTVLAPEGNGALEQPRGHASPREPASRLPRGEDAAPLRRPDVHHVGPLRQLPREHVLRAAARGRGAARAEADELSRAHAPLRLGAPLVPRSPDPLRGVLDAASRRAGRDAPRPPPREAHHPGRRARLRHGGADPGRDRRDDRLRQLPLRPVRGGAPRRALDPTREAPRDGRAVGPRRGRARVGARSATASST